MYLLLVYNVFPPNDPIYPNCVRAAYQIVVGNTIWLMIFLHIGGLHVMSMFKDTCMQCRPIMFLSPAPPGYVWIFWCFWTGVSGTICEYAGAMVNTR